MTPRTSLTPADSADMRDEPPADRARHQHREGRLAGAGRAVQHQRRRRGALHQPAQRRAGTQQVVLADHLVERGRAHADGERRVRAHPLLGAGMLLLRRAVEQFQVEPIFHGLDATRHHRQPLRLPRAAGAAPRPRTGLSPPCGVTLPTAPSSPARCKRTTGERGEEVVVSTSLPAAANLAQLRKQAKDLASAESVKLTRAQHEIAVRHGFPSWPKLRAYVERVQSNGAGLQHAFDEDPDYYADRADRPARVGVGRHAVVGRGVRALVGAADRGRRSCRRGAQPRVRELGGAAPARRRPADQRRAVRAGVPAAAGAGPRPGSASCSTGSPSWSPRAAPTATTCWHWHRRRATSGW